MKILSANKTTISFSLSVIYSLLGISYCFIYKTSLFLLIGSGIGIFFVLIYLQLHKDTFTLSQKTFFLSPEHEDAHKIKIRKDKLVQEEKIQTKDYFIPFVFASPSKPPQKKVFNIPGKRLLFFALILFTLSIFDTTMSFFTCFLGWQSMLFWGQTWVYWKSTM